MAIHTLRILPLIALILILAGCSANELYRHDYNTCVYVKPGDCAANTLQASALDTAGEYHLGFVEYDDQGQLRDRRQMQAVLDEYYKVASEEEVLLVAFVHGWHHSAKPEDQNVARFRDLLTKLSRYEAIGSTQQKRNRRKVLGLYIGWRGDSIDVEYLNALTFWERKNTAHKVGQQGVSEVLLRLEEIVNVRAAMQQQPPPPTHSRLVVIGHSFGGAVVFTSLQNVLADRYLDSRRGKALQGDARGFGDLVLLLNPAFEALRFSTLYDISQQGCRRYFASQVPKLAILTSEADYATKYAFTIGRSLSTLFETHTDLERHYCTDQGSQQRMLAEGEADRTAVGHFEPFQTHRLNAISVQSERKKDFDLLQLKRSWAEQKHAATLDFEGAELIHLGTTRPLNPYLNVKVDKELIGGHNDIWRDPLVGFIRDLIVISTTPVD